MTTIRCTIVSLAIGLLMGCVSGGPLRFDRELGSQVDEAALKIQFPLCLKVAPNSLQLTNESLKDGLRRAIRVKSNGDSQNGSWIMFKPIDVSNPRSDQIRIEMEWPLKAGTWAGIFQSGNEMTNEIIEAPTSKMLSDFERCR